jgi:hypothetical protein
MNIGDASMKQLMISNFTAAPKRPEGGRWFDVKPELPC